MERSVTRANIEVAAAVLADFMDVALGLTFLKYIPDAFEEHHAAVLAAWEEDAAELREQQAEGIQLDTAIAGDLGKLGFRNGRT